MKNTVYYKQAELLLRVLPYIEGEKVFALKGGTAINFFVRDFPRLSVDIDLTYVPVTNRADALEDITKSLHNIASRVKRIFPGCSVVCKSINNTNFLRGMVINHNNITIKVEPNIVVRGTVYKPETLELSQKAQNFFEMSVRIQTLSVEDLYASKICAALDRQHPRDLFDIHLLLKNEGIDEKMRKAFIVYLISHPRPVVELLNPNFLNIKHIFENEFAGMTFIEVSLDELLQTRQRLVSLINTSLTSNEKDFLISVKLGDPKWYLMDIPDIEKLPAVNWKLRNIKNMDKKKQSEAIKKLGKHLEQL